ncbi:GTPase HflX [Azospirillaceae bacterium]
MEDGSGHRIGGRSGLSGAALTGRALVVYPSLPDFEKRERRTVEARLEEAVGLARAISLDVIDAQALKVNRPQPATLIGGGHVEALAERIQTAAIDVTIFDHALSPVQQRNLERALKTKVIDRTGLILEIFGARARTREGQLQVELASLTYQRSRLVRSWTHLERQRGGFGFLGGPGESQLEIDRRLIDERIIRIKRELEDVRRTRGLHRDARRRVPYPVAALVGYTNAGKSTLFNRMAAAEVFAEDLLFATLDPTMRGITLPSGQRIILSDTVGFISDLPTQLVAAFHATLEEVEAADIILHVRDVSHPDSEAQREDVYRVLREIHIDPDADPRLIEVLNKIDSLPEDGREGILLQAQRDAGRDLAALSALTGEGLSGLCARIDDFLRARRLQIDVSVALEDGAALAWLYQHGHVVERRDDEMFAYVKVMLEPMDVARFERRFGKKSAQEQEVAIESPALQ